MMPWSDPPALDGRTGRGIWWHEILEVENRLADQGSCPVKLPTRNVPSTALRNIPVKHRMAPPSTFAT